jgi:hypothetical protein
LESKACKEVVLTLKLIINVFFTMSFIIDYKILNNFK